MMFPGMDLPAAWRIRLSLAVINTILLLTGILDATLGSIIAQEYICDLPDVAPRWNVLPAVWVMGLPSLTTGTLGLLLLTARTRTWVFLWILCTVLSNVGLFAYIYITDHLNPDLYGVSLNIFGQCYLGKGATCQCTWADGGFSGVLHSPCRRAWRTTVLYLVLIASFILALSIEMVAVTLQLAYVVWLPRCLQANKAKDDKELYKIDTSYAYTSYYAAEATSIKENTVINFTSHTPLLPRIPHVSPGNDRPSLNVAFIDLRDVSRVDTL